MTTHGEVVSDILAEGCKAIAILVVVTVLSLATVAILLVKMFL
jgi:hypothetical protein